METLPVHLLVPGPRPGTLLVRREGDACLLPVELVGIEEGDTLVVAVLRHLASAWSLHATVLETHIPPADGDAVEALAILEAPPLGWRPPGALAFERRAATPDGPVGPRAARWLAELADGAPVPELRPRWSRPGWTARAMAWIEGALEAAGRPPAGPPEIRRVWTLSALARVPLADGGTAWFKAVFPAFGHEPAVTRELHRLLPDAVPSVIAIDEDEGWLLLDGVPGEPIGPGADDAALERAIRRIVEVGAVARRHEDALVALGCPRRPLTGLADALGPAMADAPELDGPSVDPGRLARIVEWVRATAAWVEAAGLPETLVHGDFTVFNVIEAEGGPVIIDWSDAAIAHPLVDVGPWLGHPAAPGDPERQWRAWLDALAPFGDVDHLRDGRERVVGLASAYEVVTYARILRGIEPENRYQVSDGFRGFWAMLDERVPG